MAERYLDDALNATGVLEYRDARVEPRAVIVKTHDVAEDLSGFRGWRFSVTKRGVLQEKVEQVVWATLSTIDFLYWAKEQEPETLRKYLGVRGIEASGSSRYVLAALLTYSYEEGQLKASGSWPLSEDAMDLRLRRIAAIEAYKNAKGGMSDEEIIVAVNLRVQGYSPSSHQPEPKRGHSMTGEKSEEKAETPSEIRARLRRQAEEEGGEDAGDTEGKGEDKERGEEAEAPVRERPGRAIDPEAAAVRSGKKGAVAARESSDEKGRSAPPTRKTTKAKEKATAKAEPVGERESGEMAKRGAKKAAGGKKGSKKDGGKKAEVKHRVKYEGNIERDFPVGSKIKYIGTRLAKYTGKMGEVTGHKNADGLNIKYSDGSKGTATVGAVEIVKKGSGKK